MKQYRVKPEYEELWGTSTDTVISEEEVKRLATEWDKPEAELLEQLEEVDEMRLPWNTTADRLRFVQSKLGLNQRELSVYAGVSTRIVNQWINGTHKCSEFVCELIERVAETDAKALEADEPTSKMLRWAVIDDRGSDVFITYHGCKADALRDAEKQWGRLTKYEKERDCKSFSVALISCALIQRRRGSQPFDQWCGADGWCDADVYDTAKQYK